MSATTGTLPAHLIADAADATPCAGRFDGWRGTRSYSEWLYARDRYLVPAALFVAVNAVGFACFITACHLAGWI